MLFGKGVDLIRVLEGPEIRELSIAEITTSQRAYFARLNDKDTTAPILQDLK
jgi:hypothetical protein